MKVYKAEISDNLKDAVEKSVAKVVARFSATESPKDLDALMAELKKAKAGASVPDYVQPDLAYIKSILVSTGWNLNDDVFLADETYAAKDTPAHKPININHDETNIVGHMVEAQVLTKDGESFVKTNGEALPDNFDIEVAGVLYKAMRPDVVLDAIEKAEAGELFVSMEVLFDDFDYAFRDSAGRQKIVARNEETAFLTKYLRSYGGNGKYNGFTIGRVLKNLRFAGKGLVTEPANPDSVIKEVADNHVKATAEVDASNNHKKGGDEEMDEAQIKKLQADLEAAQASLKEATEAKAKVEAELKTTAASVETLTKQVADLTAAKTASDTKVEDLQKEVATLTERATKAEGELTEIAKNAKASERLAQLKAAGEVKDEKQALADLRDMDDKQFEVILRYAGKSQATVEPEPKEGAEPTKDEETGQANADETLATAEVEKDASLQTGGGTTSATDSAAKAIASRLFPKYVEEDEDE